MSVVGKGAAQGLQAPSLEKPGPATAGILKGGDRVVFRVLESLPANRYLIQVRQQPMSVSSRFPLQEGGMYLAEVKIRQGLIQFLSKPVPANAIESLLAQKQTLKTPLSSLLRTLMSNHSLPPGFVADCRTGDAVRRAFLNCGLFYEAKVREALGKKATHSLGEDLKGFLLRQADKHPVASMRETFLSALKQVEVKQLLSLQAGPEGPFPFWLPFGEEAAIEGFVKRSRNPGDAELLVTLRVPFLPAEEILVTLVWNARRVEVHFSAGPLAFPALRKAVHRLEEQLSGMGLPRTTVRVSRGVPKALRAQLEGIRFVESYG